MKRAYRIILSLFLFIIPFFVSASVRVVFDDAKWGANTYITDFKNYRWYIDLNTKKKYGYDGKNFSTVSGFDYGGLINQSEYNISINKNQSYLKTPRSYWTLTSKDSKYYAVENGKFSLFDKNASVAGVRPTEYIVHQTEVSGQGSYVDPWVFVKPSFYVEIEYFNTVIERDGKIIADGIAQYGDTITYSLKLKNNGLKDSVVNTREIAMVSQVNKIIKMLPETSTVKFGNRNLSLAEAKKAIQDLFSDNGYTFTIVPGQEVEIVFKVEIIGNAGEVVNSQVLYTMDGLEADPGKLNKIAVEKTVQYNEVAEVGVNVVMALDNSGSMSGTKMNQLKKATKEFINIMVGPDSNTNNKVCIVIMPSSNSVSDSSINTFCSKDYSDYTTFTNKVMDALFAYGGTPFTNTFRKSDTMLQTMIDENKLNSNYALFLSDGDSDEDYYANYSWWWSGTPRPSEYKAQASSIKNKSVFFTIGFETGTSASTALKNIATTSADSNYPGDMCLYCAKNKNCSNNTNLYEKVCYQDATSNNISEIFKNIAKKMNEKSKITTKGVLAISRNLDKSRNIVIEVTPNNGKGTPYEIKKGYTEALNESYIINKGNRYEINIKKFKSDDKISVTYFLEKN